MAVIKSKTNKVASDIYPVRTRKSELAEGLFSCPFPRKNGGPCNVSQKYRSMRIHGKNMHGEDISLKCIIGNCKWSCSPSIRCLTSHRDNHDNHGILTFNGLENLDGTCLVVPFDGDFIDEHTPACSEAKVALKRYSGKMLKRAERAAISLKHKETALKKVFKKKHPSPAKQITLVEQLAPVSAVVISLSPSKNLKTVAWKRKNLADWKSKALSNYVSVWDKCNIANIAIPVQAPKISGVTHKNKTSSSFGLKRKIKQEESFLPLKKRKSAFDYEEEVIAGPSAPVVEPVVEAVTDTRVKRTKRKLASKSGKRVYKAGLRDKLNQMREGGFERKDFDELLVKYDLHQVLALLSGENENDGMNVAEQMELITYNLLSGQAARFVRNNPVINK
jgi:hypothetical protein